MNIKKKILNIILAVSLILPVLTIPVSAADYTFSSISVGQKFEPWDTIKNDTGDVIYINFSGTFIDRGNNDTFSVGDRLILKSAYNNAVYYIDIFFRLTFDMQNHGKQIEPYDYLKNTQVILPDAPTDDDYDFKGWYIDAACTDPYDGSLSEDTTIYAKWTPKFIPVTGITGVPSFGTVGTGDSALTLGGTVTPTNATNKTITWSVKKQGGTGATNSSGKLNTSSAGTVTVTATIVKGLTASTPYTQDFDIVISRKNYTGTETGSPTLKSKNDTQVVLNPITISGQAVEYGYTDSNIVSSITWQDSTIFNNLKQNNEYYFYARVKQTDSTNASKESNGTSIKTLNTTTINEVTEKLTQTYDTNAIDLTQLFTITDGYKGALAYTVTNGTGEGTVSNNKLTVTKAGTFNIKLEAPVTSDYAATLKVITLTVNKAESNGSVSIDDWIYGMPAKNPKSSGTTNDTNSVTYQYDGTGTTTYSSTTPPKNVGTYKVTATFAANDLYEGCTVSDTFTIAEGLGTLTTTNVKSFDKSKIETFQTLLNEMSLTNATEKEKNFIAENKKLCADLLNKIEETAKEIKRITDETNSITLENVKLSDKDNLEQLKADIEKLLATENLTAFERNDMNTRLNIVNSAIEALQKIIDKPIIIAGAGSTHNISDEKEMTITCSGALEDLTGVYVDGELVDESNYTLKSGSTIITLKASYLDTLSIGTHTLKFQYKDDVFAETTFVVASNGSVPPSTNPTEKPTTNPTEKPTAKPDEITTGPATGDTNSSMSFVFLLALSAGGLLSLLNERRKRVNK